MLRWPKTANKTPSVAWAEYCSCSKPSWPYGWSCSRKIDPSRFVLEHPHWDNYRLSLSSFLIPADSPIRFMPDSLKFSRQTGESQWQFDMFHSGRQQCALCDGSALCDPVLHLLKENTSRIKETGYTVCICIAGRILHQ